MLALFRVPRWITVILGVVALGVALWFVVQIMSTLGDADNVNAFFDTVSYGPMVTIVGGFLMLSGR